MRKYLRCGLLWLACCAPALTGCMHTRYAETNSLFHTGGQCSCGSDHHSTHKERHWSGFWLGQPDQVRP